MKKTVLITGGARGIGRATAEVFAENGYNVAFTFNASSSEALDLERRLNENGAVEAFKCDVTDAESSERTVEKVLARFGKIDVLVLNAGVAKKNMLTDVSESEFDFLINVNLRGAFNFAKAAVKRMQWQKSGGIVFISSVLGRDGCSCESVYSLTKGGINAFAKSLAKELGPFGITVNTVCPGLIDTKMNDNLTPEEKADIISGIPLGRIGVPRDVANAVYFLAESPYITGAELVVAGGAIF